MRTMSDEAEQRARDEDFCSDEEADVESYLEDNSGDLVDRLKELEAENSALILANESQREAYERCLDEVANHVVQALLNQKDLREECIKLKMLVFDLEKQNRALCELFQQKLPHHSTAHYQVQAGPLLDYNAAPHNDSAKHLEAAQSEAQAKGNGYRPQHPSPAPRFPGGPAGPAASMEALSPFFKKKAHILEVLRKMEETDPLKFHPATSTLSTLTFCDYSQALASTDAVLSRPTPDLRRCPRSDAVNGGGAAVCEGGNACCLHCKRTPDALTPTPTPQAVQELSGFLPAPPSEIEPPMEPEPARADAPVSPSPSSCLSEVKAAAMGSPSKLLKLLKLPSTGDKAPPPDPGVRLSPQLTRSSRIPCRTNTYEVYHSPVPARRATTAERCRQPPPPPPTRSESYPAARAATATTPPPPRPDDAHQDDFYALEAKAPPGRSPRATVTVPLYENVRDSSSSSNGRRAGDGEPAVHAVHAPEKRTTLPTPAKTSCGERKLVKSLPLATSQQNPSSSSSSSSDEDDSDGPSWVDRPQTPEGADPPNRRPPPPPPPARRNESSSIPKRPATASKSPADSGHHAFKDRLAALGKLRVSDGDTPGGREPETAEPRLSKYQDSPDGRTRGGAKPPGAPTPSKREPKAHARPPSPNADAPQVLRNHIRCPGSLHLPHDGKPGGTTPAPNKIPAKSPSKPAPHRAAGKPAEAPRYASKSAERSKTGGGVGGVGRKNPLFGDSLPPPPPRPPPEGEKTTTAAASGSQLSPTDPQSAIEQKVMKGIEENMLKLQGGASPIVAAAAAVAAGGGEAKHKASNGIAGWFGRKKSKLPALSRKAKDERRDWRIHIPAVGKEAPLKMAAGEGVEGLTISTLMEKAEGLRRALEEERAYVERSGRGHSCRVVVDRAQGQLAVMYRGGGGGGGGGRSDNFMQQLLNRVDGKEVTSAPPRRLSFDCKRAPSLQTGHASSAIAAGGDDEPQKASRRAGDVTSDEKRSVRSAHFADSGASTYTLDSGIGTFPLPDGAPSKAKADPRRPPGSSGRRSRTLDREPPSQEDADWHRRPAVANAPPTEGRRSAVDVREDPVYSTHSKTWTFPNLKTPAEVYLAVEEEGEEVLSLATPYRTSVKGGGVSGGASSSRPADPPGSPAPPPSGMGRRVAKGPPELGRDAGLELLRERPEEALSPGRPAVPETPESLSDSLYDSLSSCGSQG